MEKIRIFYVLPLGGIGGAEKFVLSLCRSHDKTRFEITVCILFPFTGYSMADEMAAHGHEVIKLNMSNGFDIFKAMKLISIIRERKIDIVNIHGQNPMGKLFSALSSAPVVIHTDHGTTMGSPVKRRRRVVLFNRLLTPFIDGFIAISKGMEESLRLREKVPERKISLIYNGIDVKGISKPAPGGQELKKSLGIPPGVTLLGSVGRLVPEKQYPLLFKSLSLLKKEGLEFITLIVGDGPQRPYLESMIGSMELGDRVRLLGERTDVLHLLELIDVFVFSSGGEAFSITILEAMAKAKPIVAFDVEGVNEAVVQGQTGYLVPFGDVQAFAGKIEILLRSPELARKMGRLGFERVSAYFNLEENIKRTEDLYEKLLAVNF